MNRTDRLLAIVLELQNKGRQRAEDLAATFETSKRTIYRDLQALSEAGVPLLAVPGQGYELMEGYFLPPLSFTTDEASMLLLGNGFVSQNFDEEYRRVAESAGRKIEGVLPPQLREEVQQRRERIRFIAGLGSDEVILKSLRRAVIEYKTIKFRYHARQSSNPQHYREADPYTLVYVGGTWYAVAYDHLRQQMRHFRLDRMEDLTILPKTFTRPVDFKLGIRRDEIEKERAIMVQVHFDPAVVRWVKESRYFYITEQKEGPDGLLVTLRVRQEQDVVSWLLSWGRNAQVLEPESLRQRLAEEAEAIMQQYKKAEALLP